jgi:hemerythrin-like domain-containing protein
MRLGGRRLTALLTGRAARTQIDAVNDDPIGQLERSHRRLEEACDALVVASTSRDIETVSDVCAFFARQVRRHEEDEERTLFPHLRAVEPGSDLARIPERLAAEHREHEELHRRLEDAVAGRVDGDVWTTIQKVADEIMRAYRGHIEEEERALFPAARRLLGAERLASIRQEMGARRGRG